MTRKVLGVIVGYIAMVAFVFITYTLLYLILGAEGAFEPKSYHVSFIWILLSIILSFLAAVAGGYICMLIAKDKKSSIIFAAIVFVLGLIFAIPKLGGYDAIKDQIRESTLSNMEAMNMAAQPDFILLLTPIIGAVGVVMGSKIKKKDESEMESA
jgi:hypothetical protein